MSSHYKTQKPLSAELIEKLVKRHTTLCPLFCVLTLAPPSRYSNVGLFYLRQLFFAKFDMKVHTDQGMSRHTL